MPLPSVEPLVDDPCDSAVVDALAELKQTSPEFAALLRARQSAEEIRTALRHWLAERRIALLDDQRVDLLDRALACQATEVLEGLLSRRNEGISGSSSLGTLIDIHRGRRIDVVEPGFVLEFVHLLRAITCRAGRSRGWLHHSRGIQPPDLHGQLGVDAARQRSRHLDQLAGAVSEWVARYPCGLDEPLLEQRERNRRRILDVLGGSEEDWEDYRWQLSRRICGPGALETLDRLVALGDSDRVAIRLAVEHGVPFGITPYYLSLFDLNNASRRTDGQVRSQVIPSLHYVRRMIEHQASRQELDFMGEIDTSPHDLVTRRYPSVAILKALDTCPQICVYCQRNWEIEGPMSPRGYPSPSRLEAAIDWFAQHPAIVDVLVTGGDPLFHSDHRIAHIMERLAAIPHVRHIRWGTRSLVTMPMRITDHVADLLAAHVVPGQRTVSVVTHVESAAELTPSTARAASQLRQRGIRLYNQQVYTVATSRRFETVANRLALVRVGIDPYYTFYPKGKEETRGYIPPLARLLQERREEARLLPGIFRTDEPVFNVPRLGKNHVRATRDRELIAVRPDGRRVYLWHPWEKGITAVRPWKYEDEPILPYLDQLASMGEDPRDYQSIWYYW